jgi:hypothetical protein
MLTLKVSVKIVLQILTVYNVALPLMVLVNVTNALKELDFMQMGHA